MERVVCLSRATIIMRERYKGNFQPRHNTKYLMTERRSVDAVLEKYGYSSPITPQASSTVPSSLGTTDRGRNIAVDGSRVTPGSPSLDNSSVILPSPFSHIPAASALRRQHSNSSQSSSLQVRSYRSIREETIHRPRVLDSSCNTTVTGELPEDNSSKLQGITDQLEQKKKVLEAKLSDMDVSLTDSRMETVKVQSRCTMLEKDLQELQYLLAQRTDQSEKEKDKLKKELVSYLEQIAICTDEKESALQNQEKLIQTLQNSNQQMEQEILSLKKEVSTLEDSITKQQSDANGKAELSSVIWKFEAEKRMLESKIQKLSQALEEKECTIVDANNKLVEARNAEEAQRRHLELEVMRIDGTHQVKHKKAEQLNEALANYKALLEAEKSARYAADEQLSMLSIAKLEVDRDICAKNDELQDKCQRIKVLDELLADVRRELDVTKQQLMSKPSATEQIYETHKAYERAVLETQDSERRSEALQRKIEEQEASISEQKRQIEVQKSVEENLQADIAKYKQYQNQCRDYENYMQNQEEIIDGLNKEKQMLLHQIKLTRDTAASKDTDNKGLVKQLVEASLYQSEAELLNEEIRRNKEELDKYSETCSRITDELQQEKKLNYELKLRIDVLNQEKANITDERDLISDTLDKTHKCQETYNDDLRNLHAELTNAMLEISHRDELSKEMPLLRNEIEQLLKLKRQQEVTVMEQRERILDLETNICRFKLDHDDEKRRCNKYEMVINQDNMKMETQEQIIRDITAHFGRSEVLLEDGRKELEYYRADSEAKNEKIKVLEEKIKEAHKELALLHCTVDKRNDELILTKRENEDLSRRLEITDSKLEQVQELYEVQTRRVDALERDNGALVSSNSNVYSLEGQVDALRKLLASRDEERAGFDKQMQEKTEIEEKLHSSQQEIKIHMSKIEVLNSRISKAEETILSLEQDLSKQVEELGVVSRDRIKAYKELEICRNELYSCEELRQEQVKRTNEAEELAKGKASIEGKLMGTEEVLNLTKLDLVRTKDSIAALNNRIRDQDNILMTIPRMERKTQELESLLASKQELVVSLQGELDKKLAKQRSMQDTIDQKAAEVIKMRSNVLDAETTIQSITVSLKRYQRELEELEKRYGESEKTHLSTQSKLKEENSEIWKELMELRALRDEQNRLNMNTDHRMTELSESKKMIGKLNVELKMMAMTLEKKQADEEKTALVMKEYELQISQLCRDRTETTKQAASFEECAIMLVKERDNDTRAKFEAADVYENEIQHHRQELAQTHRQLCEALELAEERAHKLSEYGKLITSLECDVSNLSDNVSALKKDRDNRAILQGQKGISDRKVLSLEVRNDQLESQLRILSTKYQEIYYKLTETEKSRHHLMKNNLLAGGDHALSGPKAEMGETHHVISNEKDSFRKAGLPSQDRLMRHDIDKSKPSEYSIRTNFSRFSGDVRDASLMPVSLSDNVSIPQRQLAGSHISPTPKYPYDRSIMSVLCVNALNTTPSQ